MTVAPAVHHSPTAPRDRKWTWSGIDKMDRLIERGWGTVATAHAWFDPQIDTEHNPPREKGAYGLPHQELVDGELVLSGAVSSPA